MTKRFRREFKCKRAMRKHFAEMVMLWDSFAKSESNKKERELCIGFKKYWERKLRELG